MTTANIVARMERSEIRDSLIRIAIPDCATLHPGHELTEHVAQLDRAPQADHHDNYAKGLPIALIDLRLY
jgi:hypothetical protein